MSTPAAAPVSPALDGGDSARRSPALRGWLVAVAVYFFAVFHRSSLGVAGLIAEHRFGISPGQLSVFVLLQIGVYAAMQVPTGVLVDRLGPRRMLVVAAALMGIGQLLFAIVPSYGAALLARALLGCGDAMTFVSVLRFTAMHFSPRRYPVLVAATSVVGTVGNLLATLPLAVLLRTVGWDPSYASAATCSLIAGAVVWFALDDRFTARPRPRGREAITSGVVGVASRVRDAWSLPGTRLGFWLHFASMSTATSLGVLWGDPYLEKTLGLSSSGAGLVLMAGVLLSAIVSPLFGALIAKRPATRVPVAVAQCGITIAGWTLLIAAFGDQPPAAFAIPLFVFTTLGGPASMAAFALARDYNRASSLGTASGVVNVGGFLATVVISVGIGAVLDALGGTDAHTLRLAMLVAVAVQLYGTVRMVVWYRRVRASVRRQQESGDAVPVPVLRQFWWDLPGSTLATLPKIVIDDAQSGNSLSRKGILDIRASSEPPVEVSTLPLVDVARTR